MKQHRNDRAQSGAGKKQQGRKPASRKPAIEAIFGIHAVTSLLERQPEQVISLHLLQGRDDEKLNHILQLAGQVGTRQQFHDRDALDDMVGGLVHQGVVAVCKPLKTYSEQWLFETIAQRADQQKAPLLLVLDGVTDPHNLGAVLRTADAAGADAVILPKDRSATLNATVRKVACGAAEVMPVVSVTNLARTLGELKQHGIWVIGTAGEADQGLYATDMAGPIALVMGAEGKGMRRLTREHCDLLVNLPMAGDVSSLNVSVATGVCLYEAVRQRALL